MVHRTFRSCGPVSTRSERPVGEGALVHTVPQQTSALRPKYRMLRLNLTAALGSKPPFAAKVKSPACKHGAFEC